MGLERRQAEGVSGPDFVRHLMSFLELGCPVIVEEEALNTMEGFALDDRIQIWGREAIVRFVSRCQAAVLLHDRISDGRQAVGSRGSGHPGAVPSGDEESDGCQIHEEDRFLRILNLLLHEPGDLFRTVLRDQAKENSVTIVRAQDGSGPGAQLQGSLLCLGRQDPASHLGHIHGTIGHGELLDLIFEHDTAFCW